MSNNPDLRKKETVYKVRRGESGFKHLIRLEQKNTTWMKDILQKLIKPGNLVLDAFSGTLSLSKAFMLLSNHEIYIECEVDPSCVTEAILQQILIYAP